MNPELVLARRVSPPPAPPDHSILTRLEKCLGLLFKKRHLWKSPKTTISIVTQVLPSIDF